MEVPDFQPALHAGNSELGLALWMCRGAREELSFAWHRVYVGARSRLFIARACDVQIPQPLLVRRPTVAVAVLVLGCLLAGVGQIEGG